MEVTQSAGQVPGDGSEPDDVLYAGDFASWLSEMQAAIRGERDSDVPCGSCTACCVSSQFIHIAPEETETLAQIPRALLFPAPGAPQGHVLMGYDEHGHCPMFVDGACSIYEQRPRTCRTYDCRVFTAADVTPDDDKPVIAAQVARWRFSYSSPASQERHHSVRAVAVRLRSPNSATGGSELRNTTQLAVAAVEMATRRLRAGQ
jgi:uncharacterized protein